MKSVGSAGFRGSNCLIRGAVLCVVAGTLHAAGPLFAVNLGGSGQDFALALTSDAQGNTYVAGLTYSPDFPVTPGAVQTTFGQTCDAFITKLGPDGKRIWSTYLGGILDDWASSIALDPSGNIWVAGWTRSPNFPLVNPIQSVYNNGVTDDYDAFVAKIDPTGTKLLFSTFLGGQADDGAAGIVVDSSGNAYVAVSSSSGIGYPGAPNPPPRLGGIFVTKLAPQGTLVYSYFHAFGNAGGIALDAAGNIYVAGSFSSFNSPSTTNMFGPAGSQYAIVFKISGDGSKKFYETGLGGSVQAGAAGIAVNGAGEAYVAGTTSSVDFPLVNPLQISPGARPLWKSADGGNTFTPMDDLPFAQPQLLLPDPSTPSTVYAVSGDMGLLKSVDGTATWSKVNNGIAGTSIQTLAIDPVHPQTLYASTATVVYKSTDGASTWSAIDSPNLIVSKIAVDGQNSNIVYEVGSKIRKSTDGGATWSALTFPESVASFALDPNASGHLFAISNPVFCGFFCNSNQPAFVYRSVDGGATWIQININPTGLSVDASTHPSTIYDGLAAKSVDGGVTWTPLSAPPFQDGGPIAIDGSGNLYAATNGQGLMVSRDQAQTWSPIGFPGAPAVSAANAIGVAAIVPAGSGTLYVTFGLIATSGFVSKLSADGVTLEFSTYLRGHSSTGKFLEFLAEPLDMIEQSWIAGIALDAAGNMVVAGGTRSVDLPVVNPMQASNAGLADAFAAVIAADGSKLNYSTYFGGSQDDGALALALDAQGNAILAGQTWSGDLPIPGGLQQPTGFGEAFVLKLGTAPPVITSVVNGASFQSGIAAGSWVTIRGTNLANTNPGRKWMDSDFVGGNLPTSLDGVSVTIDGRPAFVEYISPTQINVQAPSDSAVGTVAVTVDNYGAVGAPANANLQAVAPAFFVDAGTGYAIATRLPDYAAVANPGDLMVLWGTGFGATNPAVAAGTTVGGAPAVVGTVTVTVGGMEVPVISSVLTTGTAGLYQVTVQLPANVPTGLVAVQGSVGGVSTPPGVMMLVGTGQN